MIFVSNSLVSAALLGFLFIVFLWSVTLFGRRVSRVKKFQNTFEQVRYTGDILDVIHTVTGYMRELLDIADIHILIASKEEYLETVYCTEEDREKHIKLETSLFSPYISETGTILLKENIQNQKLLAVCEKSGAEVMMVLHEKKRIFALILLGPKAKKRKYLPSDIDNLQELYPHFYLFAYYLTHIAFQPLAGIITKEIHFSQEVFQSIQATVDKIDFSGVDSAVWSSSVNGLYGNYADIIHLRDGTYLVTAGDFGSLGLPACMSLVILKTMIRLFALQTEDLKKLIILIQSFIENNLPQGTRFSSVFMLFDFESGFMHYADCGISSLLIYNPRLDEITAICAKGEALGLGCDLTKIPVFRVILRQGTSILACTGEMHEKEYIKKCLADSTTPSRTVIRRLYDSYALTDQKMQNDSCAVLIQTALSI